MCHNVATPLSAELTYTYMSWYFLWENWGKISSTKDFWMNLFCLLAVSQRNPLKNKQKTLQQYTSITLRMISILAKRQKKHQKLSTGGSSVDLTPTVSEIHPMTTGQGQEYHILNDHHNPQNAQMFNWLIFILPCPLVSIAFKC